MYEDDTPAAERRAQALSLNRDLLRELLGQEELRDLIDADALAGAGGRPPGPVRARPRARGRRPARSAAPHRRPLAGRDRRPGWRTRPTAGDVVRDAGGRAAACAMRLAGEERIIAAEDAGRYRDGLGAMPPSGLPEAFLEPVPDALRGLVARWARAHGPFHTAEVGRAVRPGAAGGRGDPGRPRDRRRAGARRAPPGRIRARVVRRRGRAPPAPRQPGRPAAGDRAGRPPRARALPARLAARRPARAPPAASRRLRDALAPLQGLALPPAQWEGEVLPRRLADYGPARARRARRPRRGGVGGRGRRRRRRRPGGDLLPRGRAAAGAAARRPRARGRGGRRAARRPRRGARASGTTCAAAVPAPREDVFSALWSLVWAGEVTNDLWLPLRAPRRLPPAPRPRHRRPPPARGRRGRGAPSAVAGRWSLAEPLFRDGAAAGRAAPRAGGAARGAPRRAHAGGGARGGRPRRLRRPSTPRWPTWRRSAPAAAATSWPASAAPSSRCRARSSACATCATRPPDEEPGRSVLGAADPAQPYGAAAAVAAARGRPAPRRASSAPRWCWWTASRASTSSAAGAACSPSTAGDRPRSSAGPPGARRLDPGRPPPPRRDRARGRRAGLRLAARGLAGRGGVPRRPARDGAAGLTAAGRPDAPAVPSQGPPGSVARSTNRAPTPTPDWSTPCAGVRGPPPA